jgi:hypothetical protein
MSGYISADNGQGMGLPATCSGYHTRHDPARLHLIGGNFVCSVCGVSYGSAPHGAFAAQRGEYGRHERLNTKPSIPEPKATR